MSPDPGISDFLQQSGVLNILLITVISGTLYIVLMAYILRRAALRRRKRRTQFSESDEPVQESKPSGPGLRLPSLNYFSSDSGSAAVASLPEPDLDMLLGTAKARPVRDDSYYARPQSTTIPSAAPVSTEVDVSEVNTSEVNASESALTVYSEDNVMETSIMEQDDSANVEMGDVVEVLRVLRDINDGSLIVQMGGKRYRKLADIQNPDLARRFSAVVRDLWSMVGGSAPRPVEATPRLKGETGVRMGRLEAEQEKARPHMLKQVAKQMLGQTDIKQGDSAKPGIANAVEEFLQYKLSISPEFSTRSIHVRPAHNHGVQIEVDGHYYEGIGDVVDPDVRDFLYTMMKEWEARQ
jgi:hypothetical protein